MANGCHPSSVGNVGIIDSVVGVRGVDGIGGMYSGCVGNILMAVGIVQDDEETMAAILLSSGKGVWHLATCR